MVEERRGMVGGVEIWDAILVGSGVGVFWEKI